MAIYEVLSLAVLVLAYFLVLVEAKSREMGWFGPSVGLEKTCAMRQSSDSVCVRRKAQGTYISC
jgi:hypothetical protein